MSDSNNCKPNIRIVRKPSKDLKARADFNIQLLSAEAILPLSNSYIKIDTSVKAFREHYHKACLYIPSEHGEKPSINQPMFINVSEEFAQRFVCLDKQYQIVSESSDSSASPSTLSSNEEDKDITLHNTIDCWEVLGTVEGFLQSLCELALVDDSFFCIRPLKVQIDQNRTDSSINFSYIATKYNQPPAKDSPRFTLSLFEGEGTKTLEELNEISMLTSGQPMQKLIPPSIPTHRRNEDGTIEDLTKEDKQLINLMHSVPTEDEVGTEIITNFKRTKKDLIPDD